MSRFQKAEAPAPSLTTKASRGPSPSIRSTNSDFGKSIESDKDREFQREANTFKSLHLSVVGLFFCIFIWHIVGIYFFTKGFLLTRLVLEDKSTCEILPFDEPEHLSLNTVSNIGDPQKGCWHPKTFDKAIIIIIDALRYDFTVPFHSAKESAQPEIFHNNLPILYETAIDSPQNAILLPFIADPPTTTLQRLKGLTTGTLPTFIDAGSNFAGTAIDEDNLVAQLHHLGKTLVHLGDDTWHALFPGYFHPNLTHPFDSFNVWDLHTVDDGVNQHIFPLLYPSNNTKWDVIFGHYLGVDHAGHRYGPNHPAMAAKLRQMDKVIRDLISKVDDQTLLVVMGDHGMDSKGDHGGESDDEVEAALWMYSKKGIFGRTNPGFVIPPKDAKERRVPQIDIVPTLSLLLGMPVPFNNLGSPIEEAFCGRSGSDFQNLAHVNRLVAAQIKRYQHKYANARGVDKSHTTGPLDLWTKAENEWLHLPGSEKADADKLKATYHAYREYERNILNVCRDLWARFDVPSMIQGIGMLFAAITILILYSRGVRSDRVAVTAQWLPRIGVGSLIGGTAGFLLPFAGLGEGLSVERMALGVAVGGMLGAISTIFTSPGSFLSPFPDSLWGWLSFFITASQSIGFASNSYTIWEDEILLFFISTFGLLAALSSMRQKPTSDRVLGTYHSILFVILGRVASFSRLCREEQLPFCRSSYYASTTSSTSAPWQMFVPFLLSLFLPAVIRSFYSRSKSYEGSASLWIGFTFRLGLLGSAIYWTLDTADDGEWIATGKALLKPVRVLVAQLVLGIAFALGTAMFVYTKPCVNIDVSTTPDSVEPGNSQQQLQQSPGRTTVTILGFANVHGTRFFFLVVSFCLGITLVQKPMGQGAIALEVWQILSLLEILDTNALSIRNSAIGPVMLGILGSFYFFKTGHQATMSSIQWESAFIALSSIRYPWSPLLVILNTLGGQVLAAVAVPLTVLWKRPIETESRFGLQLIKAQQRNEKSAAPSPENDSEIIQRAAEPNTKDSPSSCYSPMRRLVSDVAQAASTHLLYYATINLATTMWAGHLRRHLMLYRIFSPRFMLGAMVLGVVDLVVMLVAVGGVRWNTISVAEVFGW